MKGSDNPGLGNVCDLLFGDFSSGIRERCLPLLGPAGSSPAGGTVPRSPPRPHQSWLKEDTARSRCGVRGSPEGDFPGGPLTVLVCKGPTSMCTPACPLRRVGVGDPRRWHTNPNSRILAYTQTPSFVIAVKSTQSTSCHPSHF